MQGRRIAPGSSGRSVSKTSARSAEAWKSSSRRSATARSETHIVDRLSRPSSSRWPNSGRSSRAQITRSSGSPNYESRTSTRIPTLERSRRYRWLPLRRGRGALSLANRCLRRREHVCLEGGVRAGSRGDRACRTWRSRRGRGRSNSWRDPVVVARPRLRRSIAAATSRVPCDRKPSRAIPALQRARNPSRDDMPVRAGDEADRGHRAIVVLDLRVAEPHSEQPNSGVRRRDPRVPALWPLCSSTMRAFRMSRSLSRRSHRRDSESARSRSPRLRACG